MTMQSHSSLIKNQFSVFPCPNVLSVGLFASPYLLYRVIYPKAMRAACAVRQLRLFAVFSFYFLPFICVYLCSSVDASVQPSNNVRFCRILDSEDIQVRDSLYAATKHALNLNVGEPRTVRMIYFLPNDRPFRQDVVDSMKVTIRQVQTFYAEQMQAHGYGYKTFRFETDAQGEPLVHRVDGQYPDNHYLDASPDPMLNFDRDGKIYFIVYDTSIDVIRRIFSKSGGFASITSISGSGKIRHASAHLPSDFHWKTAAHELGHTFGLSHDFRDGAYIMSYGPGQNRLSACHAEFLSANSYFNADRDNKETRPPTIELISPQTYPTGSKSVSIQFKVSSTDGLHQVILFVEGDWGFEVKACRGLSGEKEAIIEFEYDGYITPVGTSLSDQALIHQLSVQAVDQYGIFADEYFKLWDASTQEHQLDTFGERAGWVLTSLSFSPDGKILATGLIDHDYDSGVIELWNVDQRQRMVTLVEGRANSTLSLSFSPDGKTLAVLLNGVELWDVTTRQQIATFGEGAGLLALAWSPDGKILATGSWDSRILLWDVTTRKQIAILKNPASESDENIYSLAWSPDRKILAAKKHATLELWDVASKHMMVSWEQEGYGHDVSFSSNGMLAFSMWNMVHLWDVDNRQHLAVLEQYSGADVNSLAWSPDGKILAIASSEVTLWDVDSYQQIATLKKGNASAVSFSPDGKILAIGTGEGTGELWYLSARGGRQQATLSLDGNSTLGDQAVTSLDVSPGSVVSLQVFGKNIQDAEGFSIRFEYDETQVIYEGFDSGGVLPNAQVLSVPGTNPTAIEIWIASFGGKAAADSGLLGSIRFRTTDTFSGTTLRLVSAELGRGEERERITFDDTSVTLQLAALTAGL